MLTTSTLLPALVVLSSFSAANAAPVDAKLTKRCGIGKCDTISNYNSNASSYTGITNSNTVNNKSSTSGSGNQNTNGNSAGGNSFAGLSLGSVCRRQYIEQRKRQIDEHVQLVARGYDAHHHPRRPRPDIVNISNKSTRVRNERTTNVNSNNREIRTNKIQSNQGDYRNNSGMMVGVGANCGRSLHELDVEKRELDTGASVLAALGGVHKRSLDDHVNLLATRDLGRMADVLGVRALGHDADNATHYKRSVGLQCNGEDCDENVKREAEEILRVHARGLGFAFEQDE